MLSAAAVAQHVLAEHGDASIAGQQEPQQHGNGGGLAGAVAAEKRHRPPGPDGGGDAVHGQHRAVLFAYFVDLDNRLGHDTIGAHERHPLVP